MRGEGWLVFFLGAQEETEEARVRERRGGDIYMASIPTVQSASANAQTVLPHVTAEANDAQVSIYATAGGSGSGVPLPPPIAGAATVSGLPSEVLVAQSDAKASGEDHIVGEGAKNAAVFSALPSDAAVAAAASTYAQDVAKYANYSKATTGAAAKDSQTYLYAAMKSGARPLPASALPSAGGEHKVKDDEDNPSGSEFNPDAASDDGESDDDESEDRRPRAKVEVKRAFVASSPPAQTDRANRGECAAAHGTARASDGDDDNDGHFVAPRPGLTPGQRGRASTELTLEQLSACFHLPSERACERLGIGLTVLKRQCRKLKIGRWPYRKIQSINKLMEKIEAGESPGEMSKALLKSVEELKQHRQWLLSCEKMDLEPSIKKLQQAFSRAEHKKRKITMGAKMNDRCNKEPKRQCTYAKIPNVGEEDEDTASDADLYEPKGVGTHRNGGGAQDDVAGGVEVRKLTQPREKRHIDMSDEGDWEDLDQMEDEAAPKRKPGRPPKKQKYYSAYSVPSVPFFSSVIGDWEVCGPSPCGFWKSLPLCEDSNYLEIEPGTTWDGPVGRLRWGVLSTANIAKKNCRAIAMSKYNTLQVVASRSIEKARNFVINHSCHDPSQIHLYESYDELLNDRRIDAVYIPLPTTLHLEYVLKAAARKKHILCEKPVALNRGDMQKMLNACRENNVVFMDGVMFMHNVRTQKIMRALDPHVGRMRQGPLRITSAFSFNGDEHFFEKNIRVQPDGDPLGCLGDLGWYCVRFALCCVRFCAPQLVRCVSMSKNEHGVPIEVDAIVRWKGSSNSFPNEEDICVLSFHVAFNRPWRQWVEVCSGDDVLTVDDFVISRPEDSSFKIESTRLCDHAVNVLRSEQVFSSPNVSQEAVMFDNFAREVAAHKAASRQGSNNQASFWPTVSATTQTILDAILASEERGGIEVDFHEFIRCS